MVKPTERWGKPPAAGPSNGHFGARSQGTIMPVAEGQSRLKKFCAACRPQNESKAKGEKTKKKEDGRKCKSRRGDDLEIKSCARKTKGNDENANRKYDFKANNNKRGPFSNKDNDRSRASKGAEREQRAEFIMPSDEDERLMNEYMCIDNCPPGDTSQCEIQSVSRRYILSSWNNVADVDRAQSDDEEEDFYPSYATTTAEDNSTISEGDEEEQDRYQFSPYEECFFQPPLPLETSSRLSSSRYSRTKLGNAQPSEHTSVNGKQISEQALLSSKCMYQPEKYRGGKYVEPKKSKSYGDLTARNPDEERWHTMPSPLEVSRGRLSTSMLFLDREIASLKLEQETLPSIEDSKNPISKMNQQWKPNHGYKARCLHRFNRWVTKAVTMLRSVRYKPRSRPEQLKKHYFSRKTRSDKPWIKEILLQQDESSSIYSSRGFLKPANSIDSLFEQVMNNASNNPEPPTRCAAVQRRRSKSKKKEDQESYDPSKLFRSLRGEPQCFRDPKQWIYGSFPSEQKKLFFKPYLTDVLNSLDALSSRAWSLMTVFEGRCSVAVIMVKGKHIRLTGDDSSSAAPGVIGLNSFTSPYPSDSHSRAKKRLRHGIELVLAPNMDILIRKRGKERVYCRKVGGKKDQGYSFDGRLPQLKAVRLFESKKIPRMKDPCDSASLIKFLDDERDIAECPCWILVINLIALRQIKERQS